jgi:hypothetical protein
VRNSLWTAARAVPSLDLRFAENKSLVDATTGAQLVTFTRASSGTFVGSDGVLQTAVTNLLLRSEDFSTTWSAINATVTTNQIASPNGTVTADLMSDNGSTPARVRQQVSVVSGQTYTASIYLKAGSQDSVLWREDNEDSLEVGVNLATGQITSGTGTIDPVGNGWYRVSFSGSVSSSGFWPEVRLASAGTVYIWGAQLEQSSAVGEYIPTTSTINSAPRFDHNPTTGESLGLLVEEARTNLLLRSEEFDNAAWVKANTTITANTIVAPDGALTGDKLVEDTDTGTHGCNQNATVVDGTLYTYSFYAKAAERTRVRIRFGTSGGGGTFLGSADFDLSNGTVIGSSSITSSSITLAGNGFYRCTATDVASGTTLGCAAFLIESGTTTSYTGDGTSGIYIWGAQLE